MSPLVRPPCRWGAVPGPSVFPRSRWNAAHSELMCAHDEFVECYETKGEPPCTAGCGYSSGPHLVATPLDHASVFHTGGVVRRALYVRTGLRWVGPLGWSARATGTSIFDFPGKYTFGQPSSDASNSVDETAPLVGFGLKLFKQAQFAAMALGGPPRVCCPGLSMHRFAETRRASSGLSNAG